MKTIVQDNDGIRHVAMGFAVAMLFAAAAIKPAHADVSQEIQAQGVQAANEIRQQVMSSLSDRQSVLAGVALAPPSQNGTVLAAEAINDIRVELRHELRAAPAQMKLATSYAVLEEPSPHAVDSAPADSAYAQADIQNYMAMGTMEKTIHALSVLTAQAYLEAYPWLANLGSLAFEQIKR